MAEYRPNKLDARMRERYQQVFKKRQKESTAMKELAAATEAAAVSSTSAAGSMSALMQQINATQAGANFKTSYSYPTWYTATTTTSSGYACGNCGSWVLTNGPVHVCGGSSGNLTGTMYFQHSETARLSEAQIEAIADRVLAKLKEREDAEREKLWAEHLAHLND